MVCLQFFLLFFYASDLVYRPHIPIPPLPPSPLPAIMMRPPPQQGRTALVFFFFFFFFLFFLFFSLGFDLQALPVTIMTQRTFFSYYPRQPLTRHRLSHLPSLANATQ